MPRPVSLVVKNTTLECSVWAMKLGLGYVNYAFIRLYTRYVVICSQIVAKSKNFPVMGSAAEGKENSYSLIRAAHV